jgi:hypothetical protein
MTIDASSELRCIGPGAFTEGVELSSMAIQARGGQLDCSCFKN